MTDCLVAVSESERELATTRRLLPPERVVTVVNGIDPLEFGAPAYREATRATLGIPADAVVAGCLSRFDRQKGYDLFLRAAAEITRRVQGVHFVFAGSGNEYERAVALADELGLTDRLCVPGSDVPTADLLASIDVFMLASRWEGLPYALLEAMAMRLPVVAFGIPGIREVVEDGRSGLLVPPGDFPALAEAAVALLTDPGRAVAMGEAGSTIVGERFRVETQIERLAALYEELVENAVQLPAGRTHTRDGRL